jgi:hypothetical protein
MQSDGLGRSRRTIRPICVNIMEYDNLVRPYQTSLTWFQPVRQFGHTGVIVITTFNLDSKFLKIDLVGFLRVLRASPTEVLNKITLHKKLKSETRPHSLTRSEANKFIIKFNNTLIVPKTHSYHSSSNKSTKIKFLCNEGTNKTLFKMNVKLS